MKHFLRYAQRFFLTLIVCLGFVATSSFAQVEEPAPAAPPAASAAPPPPAAGKPADEAFGKATLPDDPAVAALLAAKPTTPSECAKTAKILVDLHQPALAKQFLKKVVDAKLDRKQLAALGRELGSPMFLAMGQNEALQPQGKQLSDAVLEAMNAELQNPAKIAAAIKQLQDPSIEKRTQAFQELQYAGNAGIAALIEVLADPKRKRSSSTSASALAKMGRPAANAMIGILENVDRKDHDPLVEILSNDNPKLKEQIISILGDMKASDAGLVLMYFYFVKDNFVKNNIARVEEAVRNDEMLHAAAEKSLRKIIENIPSKQESVKRLLESAKNHFDRQIALPGAVDGKIEVWKWDEEKKKCEFSILSMEDAARTKAARLAREAFMINVDNLDARRLYLASSWEVIAYRQGLGIPLAGHVFQDAMIGISNKDISVAYEVYEDLLDYCIATKHYPAAAVAAELLGSFGKADEHLLYPEKGQSILVQSVQQPDRRLRMAAIRAIVKLKPKKPYPGSSNVPQALAFFAAGTGTRKALVAGPNLNKIPHLVSGLSAEGFKVDTAQTGKEVMQKLLASPDYEIAMIDAGISLPPIDLLLQQIRRDDRSADVRVGIIARAGFFEKAERAAASDPLTLDFPRPNDDNAVRWEAAQLAAIKPRNLVRPEERLREAGEALDLLAELSRTPKLYDIRRVQEARACRVECAPARRESRGRAGERQLARGAAGFGRDGQPRQLADGTSARGGRCIPRERAS